VYPALQAAVLRQLRTYLLQIPIASDSGLQEAYLAVYRSAQKLRLIK